MRTQTSASADDARACARRGLAAAQRYFGGDLGAYADAVREYETALRGFPPDDPGRVDASFVLGLLLAADHATRCAQPCPAPAELAPIVELLAVGGARDRAPLNQLYPYAMMVDKLYYHTHDPAGIDLAISWLRRAVRHRRVSPGDRRQALIAIANQHANRGDVLRGGSVSAVAFADAIRQFEQVLAELDELRRPDETSDADRLDTLLGLIETYYKRGGESALDADLDAMAGHARRLIAAMTAGYERRAYALGRSGTLLVQRIARRIAPSWGPALNAAVTSGQVAPLTKVVTAIPGAEADAGMAIAALGQAAGLSDPADRRQPLYTGALSAARALRYLACLGEEDLREFGRLSRIVLGHPRSDPAYKRWCAEFLLVVLAHELRGSGTDPLTAGHDAVRLPPSADADLDTMIGLLARFAAEDGAGLDPALSSALAEVMLLRTGGDLSDTELAEAYARQADAATALADAPAAQAMLLYRAAATEAELVRRGTAPPGLAGEVAAPPDLPPGLESIGVRALSSLGVTSHGRLAVPAGRVAEVASALLAGAPGPPGPARAAVESVLALALYTSWLRERTRSGLASSFEHVRHAIGMLPDGHPLHARLTELLAGMLLDRAQVRGDLADVDAALALLDGLLARRGAAPAPGDLNELLAAAGPRELRDLLAPSADGTYRLGLESAIGSGLLLRAVLSGGDLSPAIAALRRVAARLPAAGTRHTDVLRADVLSDLGLALLAEGRDHAVSLSEALAVAREAAEAAPSAHPRRAAILLRTAAALAANTANTANTANAANATDPQAADQARALDRGVELLTDALRSAGLDTFGERPRCLYGLGYLLLTRYARTGENADLDRAIACLDEARAGLEPVPGDPFTVPLLRALAWAYRQAGEAGQRLQLHRSRSTGRSVLYAHAQSVLLQSGSRRGLAAARLVEQDALRLAGWCLADGEVASAVDALELGRGLVLHAATVAADVPALLREAARPDLATEWEDQLLAPDGTHDTHDTHDTDAIPGDLRHQVLAVLRGGAAQRRMLEPPELARIAQALLAAQMDALVYLIPASGRTPGSAVIVGADGTARHCPLPDLSAGPDGAVARFAAAERDRRQAGQAGGAGERFADALGDLCDWAWTAAIGPLLEQFPATPARPPGVVVAPMGILGIVPWHAARRGQRYACQDAVFSACASARQLIEVAARPRLPLTAGSAVFVANPVGNLVWSQREADAICALYREPVYLGKSDQTAVSGPGSPAEVLACLSAAGERGVRPAVLHLGCHATAADSPEESRLQLAGGEYLPISRVLAQARSRPPGEPGGLVVLAACGTDLTMSDYDEALTLSSAFLAAGATGVVGSRWEVAHLSTSLLMFMLHRHLVLNPDDGPARALRAAQLWMIDPRRTIPAQMPSALAQHARRFTNGLPYAWAAFTYHGQ